MSLQNSVKLLSLGCVILLFVVLDVRAQEVAPAATEQAVPAATEPAAPAVTTPPNPSVTTIASNNVTPSEGLVSLDFQDADIKNVLKVLAYKSNMNIVSGPEVTGTVTIQLNDVPWQKALEVVLSTYGYGFERKGNIITVTTIDNLKKRHENAQLLADQEPLATKTYILSFAKASDVIDSINKMKTTRGQINFDQRTNAIIVRDVQGNLDLIDEVIKTLDAPTPQVLIEAKIIETTFSNTERIGVDWNTSFKASGGARPITFPFVKSSSSKFLTTAGSFPTDATTADFKYGTLDASGLSATLQLLSQRSDTNILSNPQIITLDNQTAKIVVGLKYPLPEYTYNQEQGKLQVSGWNYIDIGIIFEVTPHVNNAGLVTLDLSPKITSKGDSVTVENTQVPIINTEEAKTKVMIRDGQTLVIAGLVKDTTSTQNNKVPFFGDVPVLGRAFKKKGETRDKTELIIFLTPHIIVPSSMAAASTTPVATTPAAPATTPTTATP